MNVMPGENEYTTDMNIDAGDNSVSSLADGETRTNLIINYLPQNLTDQEFYKIFSAVGGIKNCRIMKDMKTGYSFGFGFVEYHKPEDSAKAILKMNNLPVQHKRIKVSYARPPGEEIKDTNLYIQNIPKEFTLEQLEEMFSPFGNIVQKIILKDKVTGAPRGVGFVRYDKKSQAESAIEGMNGVVPEGGAEPFIVKVAEEHGKMKAAYYAGYHAGRGRGGSQFSRGGSTGFPRGNYNNAPQRGGYIQPGGKIASDRGNNRYNPIGGSSAYTGGYGASGAFGGSSLYGGAGAYTHGHSQQPAGSSTFYSF